MTKQPQPETVSANPQIAALESDIAEISQRLKRPLNSVERAWLVQDRSDMRLALVQLKKEAIS